MATPIEEIVKSVDSKIVVGIEITNSSKHFDLTAAATYAECGVVQSPPPPIIAKERKGTCVFTKTPFSLYGSVGVLSYSFGDQQFSLLFSNPLDCIKYDSEFALHIPDTKTMTDQNLYNKMYTQLHESSSFTKTAIGRGNAALQLVKDGMEVSGTMSNVHHKAIIKLEVRDHFSSPYKPNY
ncbi:DELTA-thalatoxin-Avl1a-like [Chiloscyllium plagiosum]|uniref:DELTA-thalatoxin-Avl1a-like n=1 Tax=Chiloscyllium plagiosum TaxID=36176 RepID=UPI001CB81B5F|nr:DELTA-thalatoxin-Avl1a-like [Chiloscyllium plagiosum]XP_043572907.1 DELTA-thalatoxin-Avl1a-like [Chiloscyllium plagiosum]